MLSIILKGDPNKVSLFQHMWSVQFIDFIENICPFSFFLLSFCDLRVMAYEKILYPENFSALRDLVRLLLIFGQTTLV